VISIQRLLRPRSIAAVGGYFAEAVVRQCDLMGYSGQIWPVNPKRKRIVGRPCLSGLEDLPEAPDAVFVGVNRKATIAAIRSLAEMGSGGAVCYASGFREAGSEGGDLQDQLVAAAGPMPILGPNCYGLINYLDGALLWPDAHGGKRIDRGVALVTQSSNVGVNLTMSRRGVPLAYLITAGNQAMIGLHDIVHCLCADDRVTAIGIYIEGIADSAAFFKAAAHARARGKPIVVLKTGRTDASRAMAMSHTASLSGSDAVMDAYFERLAVARVDSVPQLLETLKILHLGGPLKGANIVSLSCSGGEAAIMSDAARNKSLCFRSFSDDDRTRIRQTVNPLVHVSNPFDYHTFDWGNAGRLETTFTAVMRSGFDLTALVMDFPRDGAGDIAQWDMAWGALANAARTTGRRAAVVATLGECLSETHCERLIEAGLIPLHGVDDALSAMEAAAFIGLSDPGVLPAPVEAAGEPYNLDEPGAKRLLAEFEIPVPLHRICTSARDAVEMWQSAGTAIVMKAVSASLLHKTEAGGVVLNLDSAEAITAAYDKLARIGDAVLAEVMIDNGIAEFIVGAVRDPVVGLHLIVGMGGVMTEIFRDTRVLLLPADEKEILRAIESLRIAPVLHGWRGRPAADVNAVVDIILKVQALAMTFADTLLELDINPLIVRSDGAFAVDAMIRLTKRNKE
jgi:acyl-CoA synthetase (NDP forming)